MTTLDHRQVAVNRDRAARSETDAERLAILAEKVIATGWASRALAQRTLLCGWEEAGLMVARLAEVGVVANGSSDSDRPCLIAPEGADALLERIRTTPLPPPPSTSTPPPIAEEPPAVVDTAPIDLVKPPHVPVATVVDAELVPDNSTPPQREVPLLHAVRRGGTYLVTTLPKKPVATRTVKVGRAGLRHTWTVGQGVASWGRRFGNSTTHGTYREEIRIARMSGNRDRVKELLKDLREERNDRLDRLAMLPRAALGILTALGVAAGGVLVLLLLFGIVSFFSGGGAGWAHWWGGVGSAIATAVWLLGVAWTISTWAGPPLLVVAAWREGRRAGDPPLWMLSADERKLVGAEITPARVVVALRDLGINELRKAIKEAPDAGAGLLGSIAIAGPGVEVDVRLPSGVDTSQVIGRRQRLAENLDRHEHELYITVPAARTVRLWIADPGALDLPVEPSPLVLDQSIKANVKTGRAPIGFNLRKDRVAVSLYQRHLTCTGLSNHGKTAIMRALALWLAFDVHTEFRLADLKGVGDWGMFGPNGSTPGIATCYIAGPADRHVIAAVEMVEAGVAEMNRRLESGRLDWPHLVLIVDEAQKAYMCPLKDEQGRPYGGKSAKSRFFMAAREIHNQGRAVGVVLWQGTQDPTDENFPKIVREGAHIRMSLVVGTESQAQMALGEAAVNGGAAPHLLRQDIDKGVIVMHGGVELPRGETSITVRTHFIDTKPAHEVARRAMERRRKAGVLTQAPDVETVVVDHLRNIHEAMHGERRPRTVVILGRLIEMNAAVYEPWGNDDLAEAVREYAHLGADIRKYGGDSVLRLEEIEQALELRE